jgi:hypothetical protein
MPLASLPRRVDATIHAVGRDQSHPIGEAGDDESRRQGRGRVLKAFEEGGGEWWWHEGQGLRRFSGTGKMRGGWSLPDLRQSGLSAFGDFFHRAFLLRFSCSSFSWSPSRLAISISVWRIHAPSGCAYS